MFFHIIILEVLRGDNTIDRIGLWNVREKMDHQLVLSESFQPPLSLSSLSQFQMSQNFLCQKGIVQLCLVFFSEQ